MTGVAAVFERLSPERRDLLELLLLEQARRLAAGATAEERVGRTETRLGDGREGPLSHGQRRLWLLDRLEPGNPLLNTASAVRLTGGLDLPTLCRSLAELVRRHEVLRATYAEAEDGPVQRVGPPFTPHLPVVDLSRLRAAGGIEPALARVVVQETARPFDLAAGPVLRLAAVRTRPDEHVLVVTAHHVASDAWSMGILTRELATVYRAFSAGLPSPLVELPLQYLDHAREERARLGEAELAERLAYWRERLAGAPELLDLAPERPRPPRRRFRGSTRTRRLPPELSRAAREVFRARGVTLFMGLLAVFEALLHQRTGESDVVVGVDVAQRDSPGTEGLIGLFLDQQVLRVDLAGDPRFEEVIERVRRVAAEAWEHRGVPFDRLVEELRPERRLDRNALFQVMFGLYNVPGAEADLGGVRVSTVEIEGNSAMFDLSLYFADSREGLLGMLRYDTDLFDAPAVDALLEDFELLLERSLAAPESRLSALRAELDARRTRRRGEAAERLRGAGLRAIKTTRRRSVEPRPQTPDDDPETR